MISIFVLIHVVVKQEIDFNVYYLVTNVKNNSLQKNGIKKNHHSCQQQRGYLTFLNKNNNTNDQVEP